MKTFRQFINEKQLKEGRLWKAIKTGVRKDLGKKLALAVAPGPFTPVALAMTARDIRNAYRESN
jgi:hypothetical protein